MSWKLAFALAVMLATGVAVLVAQQAAFSGPVAVAADEGRALQQEVRLLRIAVERLAEMNIRAQVAVERLNSGRAHAQRFEEQVRANNEKLGEINADLARNQEALKGWEGRLQNEQDRQQKAEIEREVVQTRAELERLKVLQQERAQANVAAGEALRLQEGANREAERALQLLEQQGPHTAKAP